MYPKIDISTETSYITQKTFFVVEQIEESNNFKNIYIKLKKKQTIIALKLIINSKNLFPHEK